MKGINQTLSLPGYICPSHILCRLVIVLIGLWTITHPATALGQDINIDASACVRAIAQTSGGINVQVTATNVKNGQVSRDDRPTIPPNPWYSPDAKMAFFLQAISDTEVGLYIRPTSGGQPILLSTVTYDDLTLALLTTNRDAVPWAWSPDSSHFAFITGLWGSKLTLTLTDVTGTVRQTQPLVPPPNGDGTYFYGWSADSAYIATSASELQVWSGKDLSPVETGLSMVWGYLDTTRYMASWSLHGHRLAALVGNKPTKLAVWSPEYGVEASTSIVLDNELFKLFWSPDEHALRLVSSTGHTAYDEIFTLNDNVLSQVAVPDQWPTFIGWTKNGNAILFLSQKLLMIDTRTGHSTVVATGDIDINDPSPDGQFIFIRTQQGQTYYVEIASIDGSNRTLLVEDTLPNGVTPPTWALYTPVAYWSPTWSRNSKYAAEEWFNADHTGHQIIVGEPGHSTKRIIDGLIVDWIEQDWLLYMDNQSQHLRLLKPAIGTQFDLGKIDRSKFAQDNTWIRVSPDKQTLIKRSKASDLQFVSLSESDPWVRSVDLGSDVNFADFSGPNTNSIIWIPQSIAWASDSTMVAIVYSDTSATGGMLKVFSREGKMLLQAPFELNPIGGSFNQLSVVWTSCE